MSHQARTSTISKVYNVKCNRDQKVNGVRGGELCEGGRKAQTPSYKMNKNWGYNIKCDVNTAMWYI